MRERGRGKGGGKCSKFPGGFGLWLPSGVKRSSRGRPFIPVLRENQAPKPGEETLGLRGL